MRTCSTLEEFSALAAGCPVCLAMGFFDGVHLGHRRVVADAAAPGALRAVLSFANHPATVLRPECAPRLLTPDARQKDALLETLGVDIHLCLPFTAELAALEADVFLGQLCTAARIVRFSVGANWHFGRGGAGNTDTLRAFAAARGIQAGVSGLLEIGGERVCSSRIRHLLAGGQFDAATALLGHPYSIAATVEHGQHLARSLGFPTANMRVPAAAAVPPNGVYAARCVIGGVPVCGVASLGVRPTIREEQKVLRLETHFPGWSGDLYGRRLVVELLRFMRPERKFSGIAELRSAIAADIAACTAGE
ncbi:MAG: riboflavin biosynthesis protein RibF [Akkermansia sp.]|nr:riboflavin biosynthesis protein RibF [Akkermansia sp.]